MTDKPTVKLEWNVNPEPDLAYYTLHFGTEPGKYTGRQNIGIPAGQTKPGTSATLTELDPYTIYYFAITATNKFGKTSVLSNEISAFMGENGIETGKDLTAIKIPTTAADDPRKNNQEVVNTIAHDKTGIKYTVTAADLAGNGDNVVTVEQSQDLVNWKPVHQEIFSGSDNAALLKFQMLMKDSNSAAPAKSFYRTSVERAQQIGTVNLGGREKAVYSIPPIPNDDPRIKGEQVKTTITQDKDGVKLNVIAADLPGAGVNKLTLKTSTDLKNWTDAKQFSFGGSDNSELLKLQIPVQDPKNLADAVSPTRFFKFNLDKEQGK